MTSPARAWLDRIRELPLTRPVSILNVCGGHERTLAAAGLRKLMPPTVNLIPGPGCPVCVCPEEDVFDAIRIALSEPVILVAFGDMLRVPVNVPKDRPGRSNRPRSVAPMSDPSRARWKLPPSPVTIQTNRSCSSSLPVSKPHWLRSRR